MKRLLERCVAKILREAGFEAVSSKGLELFTRIYEDRVCAVLTTIASRAALASRPSSSFLDLLDCVEKASAFECKRQRKKQAVFASSQPQHSSSETALFQKKRAQLFNVLRFPAGEYETEKLVEPEEWISPISTRVEKFIHIYDFMPNFPPIHTFRLTTIKQPAMKNLSSKVKNRLEQSLKSEGNMIKLIKSSGSLPGFVNYLYKKKM